MKLLISDFDHTFYTSEYQQNIKAVKKFVASGNQFVIATGRNLNQLLKDIKEYEIPISYYICNDGAVIYDQAFQLVYQKNIEPKMVTSLCQELKQEHHIFTDIMIDQNGEYTKKIGGCANKIIARPIHHIKAQKWWEERSKKFCNIKGYFSMSWLNVIDSSVNKGSAIQLLQQKNGWKKEDIYTVGDGQNDIEMNQIYQGYAMKGTIKQLQLVSIKTVSNIREVIEIIEKRG